MSGRGLVVVASSYSFDETVDRLQAAFREKAMQGLRGDRSQRRSGESRTQDAADEGGDLWKPKRRNAVDGRSSELGD